MRGIKAFFGTTALLAGLALVQPAKAQIVVNIGVQPACPYGYYGYAPYECAPMGYYGPGYFYNGIFLGMGPWGGWGYSHGWGRHRFSNEGGGRYHGGPGRMSYHENGGRAVRGGDGGNHARADGGHQAAAHRGTIHSAPARQSAPHSGNARSGSSHSPAPHNDGGGGGHRGGDEHR